MCVPECTNACVTIGTNMGIAAGFLVAAGFTVLYILIGYPLYLAVLSRRRAPAVKKDRTFQTTVSVIVAVRDGESFLGSKLDSLLALDYPRSLVEILVASDGSTDETEAIALDYADQNVILVPCPKAGKASAINRAVARARGEILFFTDVRQPIDRMALAHLVANFADESVGAVSGELRYLRDEGAAGEATDMNLYWAYELWARRQHSAIDSMFSATGCIYALRRELFASIPADTLSDDVQIPLGAFFRGRRVVFEPAAVAYDYPNVRGGEFRRKVRTLAGVWQVYARTPKLLSGANRMRMHFLSHRFGRLVLPWALLVGIAAAAALPDSMPRLLFLLLVAAMGALAALDTVMPERSPLRRLTSPPRSFISMNLAALFSIAIFCVPPEKLWQPTQLKAEEPELAVDDRQSHVRG
jgi:poly-beta-1,6-N-acetyl-D-glucosamine synthase